MGRDASCPGCLPNAPHWKASSCATLLSMRLGYLVAALLASVLSADARRVSRARVQLSAAVSKHPVPGKRGSGAAIVLSRVKEDVSWLDLYLPHLAHFVYQNGDNATSGYDASGNTCGESIVYLTFIIDHYHLLPEEVVFAHAHRESWHLKDKAAAVSRLQWGRHAFANLRHANMSCPQHWTCPVPMRWKRLLGGPARWNGSRLHPRDYTGVREIRDPLRRLRWNYDSSVRDAKILAAAWHEVFQGALGPLPETIHSPCCAEFVVARAQILQRPKVFYMHLRDWASSGRLPPTTCGRVFEHTWAMIFGEGPVSEAKAECDLLFCTNN